MGPEAIFVHGHHGNTEIHMHTNVHFHGLQVWEVKK